MVEQENTSSCSDGIELSSERVSRIIKQVEEVRKHPAMNIFLGITNITSQRVAAGEMTRKEQANFLTKLAYELAGRQPPDSNSPL